LAREVLVPLRARQVAAGEPACGALPGARTDVEDGSDALEGAEDDLRTAPVGGGRVVVAGRERHWLADRLERRGVPEVDPTTRQDAERDEARAAVDERDPGRAVGEDQCATVPGRRGVEDGRADAVDFADAGSQGPAVG